ncbi:FecR domain-containing protein [Novosphingobium sp. SG720]|uniref:FecR family protein n=1 Tax=Novosphingobium sp. SG720 TaxID=2586998 RepID=UPI001447282A|nr:FecR domain-containing protein [Novosphingobium sp. SG720]NKJ43477.1 transmembrane sensor [Novosphingobium sp. SG720]
MSDAGKEARTDEVVRDEAVAWLARLQSSSEDDDHSAFEAWYAADARHADIYDDVLDNWDRMALAAHTPAGEARGRLSTPRQSRPTSKLALATVAALVLVIFAGMGLHQLGLFGSTRPDPAQIVSQLGEIRTITLSDGSRVTLDTDSKLGIAYSTGERRLTLARGRARFDVAHEATRPFVVMAGNGMVIAHGTIFDVDVQRQRMTVSLLRGSVEVREAASGLTREARKGRLLAPGQRLVLEQRTPPGAPIALPASETRWPTGMLSFEDAPLTEVVAAANRYNSTKIMLADPDVGALRFTGAFTATDAPGLARMLAATYNLGLSRDDHGNLILAARRSS